MVNAVSGSQLSTTILFTATLLIAFDISSMTVALPVIAEAFDVEIVNAKWLISGYMLTQASTLLIFARWGDHAGYSRLFKIGISIFAAGSCLALTTANFEIVLISRFIQALGASAVVATGIPIITLSADADSKARAIAFLSSASSLGASLGPVMTGSLLEILGWRGTFLVTAGLASITAAGAWLTFARDVVAKTRFRPDIFLAALLALTIDTLLKGITEQFSWLLAAAGFALALGWRLRRYQDQRKTLLVPGYLSAVVVTALTFGAVFFYTLVPIMLQTERKLATSLIGTLMLVYPVAIFIGTRFAAKFASRLTNRTGVAIGLSLNIVGLLGLAFSTTHTELIHIASSLFVLGIGLGVFIPHNSAAILNKFSKSSVGLAGGVIGIARSFGIALGVSVAIGLRDSLSSYEMTFLLGALICFIALIVAVRTKKFPGLHSTEGGE